MEFSRVDIEKYKGYSYIPKDMLFNNKISLKAKGLLTLAFSLPGDWSHSKKYFIDKNKDGRDSVDNAITELIDAQYLLIGERDRDEAGLFGATHYQFYSEPYGQTVQKEPKFIDIQTEDADVLIRTEDAPVALMTNYHLQDEKLSLKAKGLLSIMFALPRTTIFSEEKFLKLSTDGRASVRSALKELKDNKYLMVERQRGDSGNYTNSVYSFYRMPYDLDRTSYTTFENPQLDNPQLEKPHQENQQLEKPQLDNHTQPKTKITKTNITKNLINKQQDNNIKYGKYNNVPLLSSEYESLKNKYPDKYERAIEIASENINNGTSYSNILNYILGIIGNIQIREPVMPMQDNKSASYDIELFRTQSLLRPLKYERKK